jgi:hypothetical protein
MKNLFLTSKNLIIFALILLTVGTSCKKRKGDCITCEPEPTCQNCGPNNTTIGCDGCTTTTTEPTCTTCGPNNNSTNTGGIYWVKVMGAGSYEQNTGCQRNISVYAIEAGFTALAYTCDVSAINEIYDHAGVGNLYGTIFVNGTTVSSTVVYELQGLTWSAFKQFEDSIISLSADTTKAAIK